ncbi:hypothetical protein [Streptomyces sp. NPDC060188]|uniref:hypothetical protein n=1 Tax=Streptomyces sp. NPDC060188 TaxID=3347068 RepID=UPI003658777D
MSDELPQAPGESAHPIPRDMPDQQARQGDDPWDVVSGADGREAGGDESATDVPDTDEAGTARQGAPRSDTVHPEHPGAEESTA